MLSTRSRTADVRNRRTHSVPTEPVSQRQQIASSDVVTGARRLVVGEADDDHITSIGSVLAQQLSAGKRHDRLSTRTAALDR